MFVPCPFHILSRVCVLVCVCFYFLSFLVSCVRDAKDGAAVARSDAGRLCGGSAKTVFSQLVDGSGCSREVGTRVCLTEPW